MSQTSIQQLLGYKVTKETIQDLIPHKGTGSTVRLFFECLEIRFSSMLTSTVILSTHDILRY